MALNISGVAGEVRIDGLVELNRAFKHAGKELKGEMRRAMQEVGEPVASRAQVLARQNISHIGRSGWWQMRIGATESTVYVAPKERGSKVRTRQTRPNLRPLLLDEAMIPALESQKGNLVREVERMLGELGREWSRY